MVNMPMIMLVINTAALVDGNNEPLLLLLLLDASKAGTVPSEKTT